MCMELYIVTLQKAYKLWGSQGVDLFIIEHFSHNDHNCEAYFFQFSEPDKVIC
jgi:hypothetical protein